MTNQHMIEDQVIDLLFTGARTHKVFHKPVTDAATASL